VPPGGYAGGGQVNYYEEGGAVRPGHAEGANPYPVNSARYNYWETRNHVAPPPPPPPPPPEEDVPWYKRIMDYGDTTKIDEGLAEMEEAYGGYIQNYQHGGLASATGFAGPPRGGVPPQMRGAMPRRGGIPPQMQGRPPMGGGMPWRGAPPPRAMPGGGQGMTAPWQGPGPNPMGGGRGMPRGMPPGKGPGRTSPPMMPPGGGNLPGPRDRVHPTQRMGGRDLMSRLRNQTQRFQKPSGYDPRGGPIAPPPGKGPGGVTGGPMIPPNLRGHMQRQRMMNRPRRGVPGPAGAGGPPNRVGMSDQQGGLARALQKGTGRPPMSRRSSSFR
jgi:hypothetical protein